MSRFRLRYQSSNLVVPPAGFVVGRGSECDLELDDAAVSRVHARFVVRDGALFVEDLGSRNGVHLNGARIESEARVQHGDTIEIGKHSLRALITPDAPRVASTTIELWICDRCRSPKGSEHEACPRCGSVGTSTSTAKDEPAFRSHTVPAPAVPEGLEEEALLATARRPSRFPSKPPPASKSAEPVSNADLVADLGAKSLALGRFAEAEKMLATYLDGFLQRNPSALAASDVARASLLALQLAAGLKSERWIDFVLQCYTLIQAVPPTEVVDNLYQVVGKVRYRNVRLLRSYLEVIGALKLDANDRFQRRRLEGLETMLSA